MGNKLAEASGDGGQGLEGTSELTFVLILGGVALNDAKEWLLPISKIGFSVEEEMNQQNARMLRRTAKRMP